MVDFNNDGKLDALWTTTRTGANNSAAVVWAGNGDGTFSHTPVVQQGGFTSNLPGGIANNVIGGGLSDTVLNVNEPVAGGIEYKVVYNPNHGRYELYMRPTASPAAPNQTGTAQVTLKVPHVAGSGAFTVTNLLPYTDTIWVVSSRVNAPVEAPAYDYLSLLVDFPTSNTGTFNWQNGVERLVFSFVNSGLCAGSIEIMENSDPFNMLPNSSGTNPGNEISVTGLGNDPNNDYLGSYGNGQATCSSLVSLPVKLLMHGAYDSSSGLMRDALRSLPDFPLTSPYGDGTTITNTSVLSVAGNNAIVDWVLVELHHPVISSTIVISQAGLLQRDGDLVAVDGVSPLTLTPPSNNYYVAVRHRNHLGTMTASPLLLSPSTPLIDFTTMSATAGSHGQRLLNTTYLLWAGDASGDNRVIGAGPGNDLNPIRATVLAAPGNVNYNRNYTVAGYSRTDLNLDGLTTAAGPGDDINYIYNSVFLHPANFGIAVNYVIQEQLP